MTDEPTCIAFSAWMPHALLAALAFGAAIGFSFRWTLDYAELMAYRRIALKASQMSDVIHDRSV